MWKNVSQSNVYPFFRHYTFESWIFYLPLSQGHSCLKLCNAMGYSLPGSSIHGDSPGKSTGVGCHPSSRESSQSRDQTPVSHIAGAFFTIWATRGALPRTYPLLFPMTVITPYFIYHTQESLIKWTESEFNLMIIFNLLFFKEII